MSYNVLENIWPEWKAEEKPIGVGSFGTVYKATRNEGGVVKESAVKVISFPKDEDTLDSLYEGGADELSEAALRSAVDAYINEIRAMEALKDEHNVVAIEDYKVIEREGSFGWDIYIRMELLTPLTKYISDRNMSEEETKKLGLDILNALSALGKRSMLHRDIKPSNIFVNEFGDFKLGDFGFAKYFEGTTGSHTVAGTPDYMAPEVSRTGRYGAKADIYSLGMVLYTCLNKKRLPFLDTEKQILTPAERETALDRRLSGEKLPPPCEASQSFADVILCACEPDPRDRFATPEAFGNTLSTVVTCGAKPEPAKVKKASVPAEKKPEKAKGKGKKTAVIVSVIAAALIAAILAAVLIVPKLAGGAKDPVAAEASPSPETTPAPKPTEAPTPEPTEVPDGVRFADAYAAYLQYIQGKKASIDMYFFQKGFQWQEHFFPNYEQVFGKKPDPMTEENTPRPIAFADIWGDETPELILFDTIGEYEYAISRLCVLTCLDGRLHTLYEAEWDGWGSEKSYTLFKTAESKNMYCVWENGDGYILEVLLAFEPAEGDRLVSREICSHEWSDEYPTDFPEVFLGENSERISKELYDEITNGIYETRTETLIYGSPIVERWEAQAFISLNDCIAMTSDEAIAWLTEKLEGTGKVVTYPRPVEDIGSFLAEIPSDYSFSKYAGAWGESLFIAPDGTVSGSYYSRIFAMDEDYDIELDYCNFKFTMTDLIWEGPNAVSFVVKDLTLDVPVGTAEIVVEDGVRIKQIACDPFCIREGDRFVIYMRGIPTAELSKDLVDLAMSTYAMGEESNLPFWGIFSAEHDALFYSYGSDD